MSNEKKAASSKGIGIGAKLKQVSDTNLLLGITIIVFFAMYLSGMIFLGEGFLRPQTFCDMFDENATLIVVACGLSIVMIAGGIDISVGGMVSLICMSCAVYFRDMNGNIPMAILIALGIGLAFGAIQGMLVAYLDIQPFIITLAGMFFARGLTSIISTDKVYADENPVFKAFTDKLNRIDIPGFGSSKTIDGTTKFINAHIQISVIVAIIVVIIMFCVLRWTKFGRALYAVGGNKQSALMLGINVKLTKFLSHLVCGALVGIGGFLYLLNRKSGSTQYAEGMEMNAIASSIIGGTMLTGGVGNLVGTFFGVLSLHTIQQIVISAGFQEAYWKNITVGSVLCIFLVLQSVIMARKHRA